MSRSVENLDEFMQSRERESRRWTTLTIRILSLESSLSFLRLVYVTLVLIETPANTRPQRCARDGGYLSDLPNTVGGRSV